MSIWQGTRDSADRAYHVRELSLRDAAGHWGRGCYRPWEELPAALRGRCGLEAAALLRGAVIELVLGTTDEDMRGGLLDLHMLVCTGGRERTEAHLRTLEAA